MRSVLFMTETKTPNLTQFGAFVLYLVPVYYFLAAFFRSAHLNFIMSEMRFLAAALKRRRPRLPRLPLPGTGPGLRPRLRPFPPSRAAMAWSSRSLSDLSSESMLCVSIGLLRTPSYQGGFLICNHNRSKYNEL